MAVIALFACFASGCASVPPIYKPTQIGVLPNACPIDGLVMNLQPDRSFARIGDLLTFDITIKNIGNKALWLPAEPDILLTWVYPDGKCDNFVRDEDAQGAPLKLSPLAPGEERRFCSRVSTDYFSRRGVTEFRARMSIPRPPPNAPGRAWAGDIASNGFGVVFAH